MTATAIRAKLTNLGDGVTMSTPSPMVRVLWHHNDGEHIIAYLGFQDRELANKCYQYLLGRVGKFDRSTNAGICKPRKATRVDGAELEIKWHASCA